MRARSAAPDYRYYTAVRDRHTGGWPSCPWPQLAPAAITERGSDVLNLRPLVWGIRT
jgi:hypothetical protein